MTDHQPDPSANEAVLGELSAAFAGPEREGYDFDDPSIDRKLGIDDAVFDDKLVQGPFREWGQLLIAQGGVLFEATQRYLSVHKARPSFMALMQDVGEGLAHDGVTGRVVAADPQLRERVDRVARRRGVDAHIHRSVVAARRRVGPRRPPHAEGTGTG